MGKKDGSPLRIGKYAPRWEPIQVVMHDIPPYSIAVGNPARVVKTWDFAGSGGYLLTRDYRPSLQGSTASRKPRSKP